MTNEKTISSSGPSGVRNRKVILDALQSLGAGWHKRRELAAAIGRSGKLNKSDVAAIETLIADGVIERSAVRANDYNMIYENVYRLVNPSVSSDTENSNGGQD
jgi:hypothetical protein